MGTRERVQAAVAAAAGGDWSPLREGLKGVSPQTAYNLIADVGDKLPLDTPLGALIDAENDPAATMLGGGLLYFRSRRLRGFAQVDHVTEAQWDAYIPAHADADALLERAALADPSNGVTAALLMGVRIDSDAFDKTAAEHMLLNARGVPASGYMNLLMASTQKWGGSHEKMWEVARRHTSDDDIGTLCLVARAHQEQWLWHAAFAEDERILARSYFDPATVDELAENARKILAARSRADRASTLLAANWVAGTLVLAKEPFRARALLRLIGKESERWAFMFAAPLGSDGFKYNLSRLRAFLPPV